MRNPTILLASFAMLTGCFYPSYYQPAPRYYYMPGPIPGAQAAPELAPPSAPAQPAPAAPAPRSSTNESPEQKMRRLQQERDAAQSALDSYSSGYYRRSLAPRAVARPAARPLPAKTRAPSLTSLGISVGGRILDNPIDDTSLMANVGLGFTHHFAGSHAALDLGVNYAGFTETGAVTDRIFSSFEATAGLRLMASEIDHRQRGKRSTFYVGGGVMAIEVIDTIEDSVTGSTLAEEQDSATGSYVSLGVHYRDNLITSSDFEIRQIMNTSYSTYGQARSSDGIELLLKFSLEF